MICYFHFSFRFCSIKVQLFRILILFKYIYLYTQGAVSSCGHPSTVMIMMMMMIFFYPKYVIAWIKNNVGTGFKITSYYISKLYTTLCACFLFLVYLFTIRAKLLLWEINIRQFVECSHDVNVNKKNQAL